MTGDDAKERTLLRGLETEVEQARSAYAGKLEKARGVAEGRGMPNGSAEDRVHAVQRALAEAELYKLAYDEKVLHYDRARRELDSGRAAKLADASLTLVHDQADAARAQLDLAAIHGLNARRSRGIWIAVALALGLQVVVALLAVSVALAQYRLDKYVADHPRGCADAK